MEERKLSSVFTGAKMYIFASAVVGFSAVIYMAKRHFGGGVCRSKARMDGKVVIITGANTGIGKETALDLAGRGARVIMACRDLTKANNAARDIRQQSANAQVVVKHLDLASLRSVRQFAKEIQEEESKLHVLINNAGIMVCPEWKTEDGYEMQFGVNHLGHFLLTNLLLDLIQRSTPARIVNVSSEGHRYWNATINFDDLNSEKKYDRRFAYGQSKLANVLFTRELAKRLEGTGVTANSLHPGVVTTELGRHMKITFLRKMIFYSTRWLIFKNPTQGAQTTICCAVDETLDGVTGKYFKDCEVFPESEEARDDGVAKKLWEVSARMVDLDSSSTVDTE